MSFWELFIVVLVGLIVIGPDKLPETIKSFIKWSTQIKRALNHTKTEFEHQLGLEDIRREIHNEQVMASLEKLKQETENLKAEVNADTDHDDDAKDSGFVGDKELEFEQYFDPNAEEIPFSDMPLSAEGASKVNSDENHASSEKSSSPSEESLSSQTDSKN